jgi:hypothetical protein
MPWRSKPESRTPISAPLLERRPPHTIGFYLLRPVAVGINPAVRIAGPIESAVIPIPAGPTAAKMPEVVASSDVNMASANVHMGPACGEVTSTEVTAGKVTAAEVAPAEVTAAVSATSMTASATASKGRCRDCRTTQKDGADSYEQYFSQHQDLHHAVFRHQALQPQSSGHRRDLQDDARRRLAAAGTTRKSRASAASASNFSVRLGC